MHTVAGEHDGAEATLQFREKLVELHLWDKHPRVLGLRILAGHALPPSHTGGGMRDGTLAAPLARF
ncbi:hypothetical protein GCM10022402_28100 [Salinactinospora qingdaonensis]|uniref:Uncharacterized protein n=1 Tax=Salinactinospora qingdaonensis TaxID=702744 RepID=A0ABP7FSY4_9ACTN